MATAEKAQTGFEQTFKNIDDVLWKEAGSLGDGWLLRRRRNQQEGYEIMDDTFHYSDRFSSLNPLLMTP